MQTTGISADAPPPRGPVRRFRPGPASGRILSTTGGKGSPGVALRIVVADDNDDLLDAARDVLAAAPDLEVVAAVRTGAEALAAAAEHRPDVILLDVEMPGGGPALAEELSRLHPSVRLMCLSARDEPDTVLAMLAAGCTGYVAKGGLDDDLATCVRRCAAGMLFVIADCAPDVSRRIGVLMRAPAAAFLTRPGPDALPGAVQSTLVRTWRRWQRWQRSMAARRGDHGAPCRRRRPKPRLGSSPRAVPTGPRPCWPQPARRDRAAAAGFVAGPGRAPVDRGAFRRRAGGAACSTFPRKLPV